MKILVGMSGGVDSSVAALLLKQEGHEVIGATMSIWDNNDTFRRLTGKGCFSPHDEDISQAENICTQLGIKHLLIDCTQEYRQAVLNNFRSEYAAGRTPNPCVVCNSRIKFNVLPQAARNRGVVFDKFATGHYAGLRFNADSGLYQILRAADAKKDQSYFLYRLTQEQLAQILLPLGGKTKAEIRELAAKAGLQVAAKPDSQDFYTGELNDILCFAPRSGNFVTKNGKILGTHNGYWNFTIGQRRGLGLSADRPLYVIGINKEKNEVIVGYAEEGLHRELTASDWIWQIPEPRQSFHCRAKIRSSQPPVTVEVFPLDDDRCRVTFAVPQSAVAPGQSVVLYDDNAILGGGIIE